MENAAGGMLPDSGVKLPATVRVIEEIEPGLHLVSINEGRPEYLVTADWVQQGLPGVLENLSSHSAKLGLNEADELRLRFEALASAWESRADHDEKFAQGVPEDVQDAMLDAVADWRHRAANVRAILEEVPRSDLGQGVRGMQSPDDAASRD